MKKIVFGVAVFAGAVAVGATTYEVDVNDAKTYVVTVPKGESSEITEAAANLLNDNTYTNFVKRGVRNACREPRSRIVRRTGRD